MNNTKLYAVVRKVTLSKESDCGSGMPRYQLIIDDSDRGSKWAIYDDVYEANKLCDEMKRHWPSETYLVVDNLLT